MRESSGSTVVSQSRFVPVEDSTLIALVQYTEWRQKLCLRIQDDTFFVSERGTKLCDSAVHRTFAKMSRTIGLRVVLDNRRIRRGPRLQDIRHTFATRKLVEWYQAGLDVEREMPKLATYLGHVDVAHTYWYIEAVPELLQSATEYLSNHHRGGVQ